MVYLSELLDFGHFLCIAEKKNSQKQIDPFISSDRRRELDRTK